MARQPAPPKQIDTLTHDAATRRNIPTAEMESFFRRDEDGAPLPPKHYPRARPLAAGETRTAGEPDKPELIWNGARITITPAQMAELAETGTLTLSDAQLVWRGKDRQDWSDLVVNVPPLYIQEKIHPKAIIDDLKRRSTKAKAAASDAPDLFADFNGIEPDQRAEFYQHDQHWSNRMILGDSLQVMASLSERESLRGKVQCIYFDPPYGIKFNSNWQVSTQSRDVKDGKQADISREPEQVKAFRDTWKDGIHSYLTYLRDRLTAMRDLLTESGSIFVQISDENMHKVRAVLDEVFGTTNCIAVIDFTTTSAQTSRYLSNPKDYILWFGKNADQTKFRQPYVQKRLSIDGASVWSHIDDGQIRRRLSAIEAADISQLSEKFRIFRLGDTTSQRQGRPTGEESAMGYPFAFEEKTYRPPGTRGWSTTQQGMERLRRADRLWAVKNSLRVTRYHSDFPAVPVTSSWDDTSTGSFTADKIYVVQTSQKAIERCIQMSTDPGDLILDPTCGSGTTAFVAEQWGRRWITIDTSRVALALARTRLMAARYPWYLLADSRAGRIKEAALTQSVPSDTPVRDDIRQGFVYERVPHITLKSIANNLLIDDIWERYEPHVSRAMQAINSELAGTQLTFDITAGGRAGQTIWFDMDVEDGKSSYGDDVPDPALLEWEIPLEAPADWPDEAKMALVDFWKARLSRQREIDASIAARADVEYLYDKPYTDNARVRVAGPFTVESLSPHRVAPADSAELIDDVAAFEGKHSSTDAATTDFAAVVIDYLRAEGVKQQAKGDRIVFDQLTAWPGNFIGATGTFHEREGGSERRAAILIGPEYGTVGRQDLIAAAREAVDARFDVLIACAFNFDAHSSELGNLGSLIILKARINPDMHMSDELKNTGRGNMFVVFGEPDVTIVEDGAQLRVKVNGVDVFDPNTGDIRSSDTKGIAAWFIDTDYNEESFFVRHAYFLGEGDPYKSLKTALQAEIDEDAWATLYSDTSRTFDRPAGGRIAVKVINHFGDEVMKVFGI